MVDILIMLNQQRLTKTVTYGNVLQKTFVPVCIYFLYFIHRLIPFRSDKDLTINYTSQFLGVQYFIDLSIIQYATNITQNPSSVILYFHSISIIMLMFS
jgi:hypothetical protein